MDEPAQKALKEVRKLLSRHRDVKLESEGTADAGCDPSSDAWIHREIPVRIHFISESICQTAAESQEQVADAVRLLRDWMVQGATVRVIGAGRAKLAGAIPANRLAHGGARVHIQDDIVPMPHSIRGGGILAVSASGRTESVLNVLRNVREKGRRIKVLGIARADADEFRGLCDVFIGIVEAEEPCVNPLRALADTGEQIISELLDAIVVAAGKLAGFDDTKWRIGHEDIGASGPYDMAHTDTAPGHAMTI
jgi:D-arabinose 5-phosphate isomerase GutQ